MMFTSIHKQLTALAELVPAELVTPPQTAEAARAYLQQRLTGLWEGSWKKARNKNPRSSQYSINHAPPLGPGFQAAGSTTMRPRWGRNSAVRESTHMRPPWGRGNESPWFVNVQL